jgi:hypothetical protein
MLFKKINIFIILGIILTYSCKKNEKAQENFLKKYDTKEIIGFWKVIPSENETYLLFEEGGNAKLLNDNIPKQIFLYSDINGLRFFYNDNEETPFAYFLFTEKKDNVWTGLFDNHLIRIERVLTKKKSVLE